MSPWFPTLAEQTVADPARRRTCILLWMSGGPSQLDTFDPKPEHENGGQAKGVDGRLPVVVIYGVLDRLSHPLCLRSHPAEEGRRYESVKHRLLVAESRRL